MIREAAKILEVDRELIDPCLDELVTDEGVVREDVPDSRDPAASTIAAVYLVPFHRAERSLAGGLVDLLRSREERLPAFAEVDWPNGAGLAADPDRSGPRGRPARRGQARAHQQGRGADRRAGLRQELHRPLGRHARDGQEGHRDAGRAHRPGRQAAGRADRPRGLHRSPAAGAAARRRAPNTTATTPSTPTWSWSTRPR